LNPGKLAVGVLWALCLGAFLVETESTLAYLGRVTFGLLVVVHAIECGVFFPLLRKSGGSLAGNLLQTFAFGFLHVREIRAQAKKRTTSL